MRMHKVLVQMTSKGLCLYVDGEFVRYAKSIETVQEGDMCVDVCLSIPFKELVGKGIDGKEFFRIEN